MTLHNFEKQIKEKLRRREIKPSKRAWQEISSELEQEENPKKAQYYRYAIAAGFIGLVMISILYYKADKRAENAVQIVESTAEANDVEKIKHSPNKEFKAVVHTEDDENNEEAGDNKNSTEDQQLRTDMSGKLAVDSHLPTKAVAQKVNVAPKPVDQLIDLKVTEVMTQVDLLEKDKTSLTDAEVDSLLRRAQQEILTANLLRETKSVDATALLGEVEDELDQSFRDQIFEKLKTGFIKVRTAVADRNN